MTFTSISSMAPLIEPVVLLLFYLFCTFALAVFCLEVLASLRSSKIRECWRCDPWLACVALLFSPVVLLLDLGLRFLKGLWKLTRLVLVILLIFLAVLVSPLFLLAIPLAFLGFRLFQAAAPVGSRIFTLSLEFFNRIEDRLGARKLEHQL
jgi:hypothetical protein